MCFTNKNLHNQILFPGQTYDDTFPKISDNKHLKQKRTAYQHNYRLNDSSMSKKLTQNSNLSCHHTELTTGSNTRPSEPNIQKTTATSQLKSNVATLPKQHEQGCSYDSSHSSKQDATLQANRFEGRGERHITNTSSTQSQEVNKQLDTTSDVIFKSQTIPDCVVFKDECINTSLHVTSDTATNNNLIKSNSTVVNNSLLSLAEAAKLKDIIDTHNDMAKMHSFNLRNLIKTGKRVSHSLLRDIYETLFGIQDNVTFPTLNFNVSINGMSNGLKCHIDTGTNYSFINAKLVQNCQLQTDALPKIVAANNQPINILGRIQLYMTICDKQYTVNFLAVENLALDIIIGNRFLLEHSMEISFKDKQIRIFNNAENSFDIIEMNTSWILNLHSSNILSSVLDSNKSEDVTEVRSDKEYHVKPKQHLKIIELPENQHEFEFEQNINLQDRRKLHTYIATDFNTNKKYIQVYNSGSSSKKIKQNALLGYLKIVNKRIKAKTPHTLVSPTLSKRDTDLTPVSNDTLLTHHPDKIQVFDINGEKLNINPNLTVLQHNQVATVLKKYKHMFTNKTEDLTQAKWPPVRLQLKDDAKPCYIPPYRQPLSEKQALEQEIEKLIKANVLEESNGYTEFQSPIFLVTNKDKTRRLISDLRQINSRIVPEQFPLVSIDTVLACLSGMQYFSKMDVKNSFFQIEIDPRDRHILTVASETGKYQYRVLPQGLCNSTAIFQRVINKILSKHLFSKTLSYIDDLAILGNTFQLQLENLDTVLNELDTFNIKLNTNKSQFMSEKIEILGHEISKNGITPLQRNVNAITKIERPKTIKQVRSALGAFNFFRAHIPNFADIAIPLTNLIKEYNRTKHFKWTQDCENAFNKLKTILTTAPVLAHFDPNLETRIYTDASNQAIGAVLCNYNPVTKKENPVQYFSKKLKPTQLSLSVSEKEFFSLVTALNRWREYCLGRKIHIFTDHSSLQFYKNFKGSSSRLTRLALHIVDYDIEVHHKSGKTLTLPDYLSRNPVINEEDNEPNIIETETLNTLLHVDLAQLQRTDENLNQLITAIENPLQSSKKNRTKSKDFRLLNNILYKKKAGSNRNYVIALPQQLRTQVLQDFHDDPMSGGHLNADKTYKKIKDKYYWFKMRNDIEQYIRSCDSCQKRKIPNLKPPGFLQPIAPTLNPFTRVQADIIGPLCPSNKYKYILCVTCVSTRMAFVFPLTTADAPSVAKCLIKLINTYGVFNILQTDRGTPFTAQIIHNLHTALGMCQIFSSAYSPNVNGLVEAFNKTLINIISHYVRENPSKWSNYLQQAAFVYNNTSHSCHNYKPSYLFFGFEPKMPSDTLIVLPEAEKDIIDNLKIIEEVRKTVPNLIRKQQCKQKYYYDQHRRHLELIPGDEVLVWYPKHLRDNSTKFSYKYKGPFMVTRKLSPVSYEIEILKNGRLVKDSIHVQRLKLYHRRDHIDHRN